MTARLTTHGLGIALYLVAIFFFALNDALGKNGWFRITASGSC
jgi:hypothetical protein